MLLLNKTCHIFQKWLSSAKYSKQKCRLLNKELKICASSTNWKTEDLQFRCGYRTVPLSTVTFICVNNNSKKFLVAPRTFRNQLCSYHSVQCSLKSQTRREGNILAASSYINPVYNIEKRHLSFEWLDNLAVTQASWFQSLSRSQLVEGLMGVLQKIHDTLHIPWWMSIIISTVLLRGVVTFPFAVYQNYIFAKVENLKPEMDELVKELKRETAIAIKKFGWKENHARFMYNRSAKRLWNELIIRENCHPFKASLLLWVQIPFWVAMSVSFRNMASMMPYQDAAAQVLFLELSTGGFLWIPNLTEIDHSFILPVAMGLTNLLNIEINALSKSNAPSRRQKIITNLFRGVSIILIPIAASVPSCIALYWVTSSVCALVQNLALLHPGVRQACRIPWTPSQIPSPYQHLWNQFQKRITPGK